MGSKRFPDSKPSGARSLSGWSLYVPEVYSLALFEFPGFFSQFKDMHLEIHSGTDRRFEYMFHSCLSYMLALPLADDLSGLFPKAAGLADL